ncbi:MAG TPA: ATP-binding protein [Marmoricola sp.]|nr:ATP-binding protein [Marmoricola sp.]
MSPPVTARPLTLSGPARVRVVAGLLLLELLLGWAAVSYAAAGHTLSPYWPNAGIAVLALCLTEPRWRPAVLAVNFPVAVAAMMLGGRPADVALGLGVSNVVEPAIVVAVLTAGRAFPRLRTLQDFAKLVAATIAGSAVGAFLVALAVSQLGDGDLWTVARAAFTSHASAILIIALLGMQVPRPVNVRAGRIEAALQWSLLFATVLAVYLPRQDLQLTILTFPLLLWGAARLRPQAMALQLVVYAALTATLTTVGAGPYATDGEIHGLEPEVIGTLYSAGLLCAALVVIPLMIVIAEHERTLLRLRQNYSSMSSILAATTGTAILGTSPTGRIEFFNIGAEKLTGHRADDVVDKASLALVRGDAGQLQLRIAPGQEPDPVALEALIAPFLTGESGNFTSDWEFVREDGEVRTISVAISRRLGDSGEPVGYLGVADDVTERRRHEAMVEAALESEKQLVERLAQVDVAKNDFMATVSHELRTPTTSIIGYSELLLSDETGALPAMHHQIIGRIERNGRRLMGLVDDILTMSQVRLGEFRYSMAVTDLCDCVQRALASVQPQLTPSYLTLEHELGDEELKVLGDAEKLERVFANLLGNAIKFSHAGDTIKVRLDHEGGEAVFRVSDTGVGISLEDQAHLFDQFFRGADAHSRATQGAGLGLSIAGSIIAAHEGRIDVTSQLGVGSTFEVRLPLLHAD